MANSSLGDWKDKFVTHRIIIFKSEVSTVPIVVIIFRGSVYGCCATMFCHLLLHIYSGDTGTSFLLLICSLWCVQILRAHTCGWCPFICSLHNLIITIINTYLMALDYTSWQVYAIEYGAKITSILTVLYYSLYGSVCLQLNPFSCHNRKNVYFINCHYQISIWIIKHCSWLGHVTMVSTVCLAVLLHQHLTHENMNVVESK